MLTVLFQPDDVAAMLPEWRSAEVLSLTPAVAGVAAQSGLRVRTTLDVFSDCAHARCVAAARRAIREFDLAALKHDLSPSFILVGRQTAWYVANITQRIALTVPDAPMRLRDHLGQWRDAAGRADLVAHLFPRILEMGLAHRLPGRRPWLPWLYNRLAVTAARMARGCAPWIFTPAALKLGFAKAFEAAGLRVGRIELTGGTPDDYRVLARVMLGRSSVFRIAPVAANSDAVMQAMRSFEALEPAYSNRFVRLGWRLYLPFLRKNLAGMLALTTTGGEVLRAANARAVASYESNGWASPALFEAARRNGIETVVVNHNSHALVGSPIADTVISHYCEQRKGAALATAAVHWTPSDAAIADRWAKAPRSLLCRFEYPAPRAANRQRFRVLHAGNYQEWTDFFPWVAESSDEFVRGIAELARAAAGIPDLDLIIRVRPKMEVNADVLRQSIPAADNVQICTTDDDFLQQLADSDLMVSYFSTTVAQALQMGKPVLLWGSTKRFKQFDARLTPPNANERSAVYAVERGSDLRSMLLAIRDQHRDRPLTRDEAKRYRFGSDVFGMNDIATRLAPKIR
jgi:hypothetical protein